MAPPPAGPLPPPAAPESGASRWAFYLVALLVPLGFVVAAFAGALGPGFRLDGTVDHVAVVLVDVTVSTVRVDEAADAAHMDPVAFGWCPQAQMDGNRLLWFGDNNDARASVVILVTYNGDPRLGGHGGNQLVETILPGAEHAVRPAFKAAPPLYRLLAAQTVTTTPGAATPTGPDGYRATYNVTGTDPWAGPFEPTGNSTVTEVHARVTGYGVPVVRQAAPMCI